MELPKSVKIDGKKWRVLHRKPPYNGRGKAAVGYTTDDRTIYISPAVSPKRQLQVLIHEVLHASLWDLDETAIERAEDAVWDAIKGFIRFE